MTELFKIATWNINSIRIRQEQLKNWLQRNNIDVLLLQEIKCQNEKFPTEDLSDLGYNCYTVGQKSYNGVAILSKYPADEIFTNFDQNPCPEEARFIEIKGQFPIGYCRIISVYVPNGGEAYSDKFQTKLKFLDNLKLYLNEREIDEKLIIGGDFNVAPEEIDVYSVHAMKDVTCFTDIERAKIRAIFNAGLIDPFRIKDDKVGAYSWWDYRAGSFMHDKGLRIDYFLTNAACIRLVNNFITDKTERAKEKASDHAPVIMEMRLH